MFFIASSLIYAPFLSQNCVFIVKPENICTPPVGAVSNRTEFGVKLITESTIIDNKPLFKIILN